MQRASHFYRLSPGGTGLRQGLEPDPLRTCQAHGTMQVPSEPRKLQCRHHMDEKKVGKKVLPRFELGSWDSESQVLTITP